MAYLRKRIQNWFAALSVESKCYVIGLGGGLLAAVLAMFFSQAGAFVFTVGLLQLIESL